MKHLAKISINTLFLFSIIFIFQACDKEVLTDKTEVTISDENAVDTNAYMLTTFAGKGGEYGYKDGPALEARFDYNFGGMTAAEDGTLYFISNNRIRKLSTNNVVTTVAGTGVTGCKDGLSNVAEFNYPDGIAVMKDGTLFVSDKGNHCIRKIATNGKVSTYAGNNNRPGDKDGPLKDAEFRNPAGIEIGTDGSLYVYDNIPTRLRKISPNGIVSTIKEPFIEDVNPEYYEYQDIAVANDGTVYAISQYVLSGGTPGFLTKITADGIVTKRDLGFAFRDPTAITFSADDGRTIYIADISYAGAGASFISTISPSGNITHIAGDFNLGFDEDNRPVYYREGPALTITLTGISTMTISKNALYFYDSGRICKVTLP